MKKWTSTIALTICLLLLWAVPASAHAGLMPGDLAPGVLTEGELAVVHGCGPGGTIPANDEEELATTAVVLVRPDGLTFVPREVEGWTLSTETGTDGEVTRARWDADDPHGELGAIFLGVDVTADEAVDGSSVWVQVVQECGPDEQLAWITEGVAETEGALPAMLVNVDSAVMAASAAPSEGLPTSVIVTLAVALAIAAGGGVAVFTSRRA